MDDFECGKFCNTCNKTVIDFSILNDNQIKSILDHAHGKVCGRINISQVNRPLELTDKTSKYSLNKIFLGFSLTTIFNSSLSSKTSINPIVSFYSTDKLIDQNISRTVTDTLRSFTCKILDSKTKEPIPYVPILIKDLDLTLQSDSNGAFVFSVPSSFKHNTLEVRANYIGYETKTFYIDLTRDKTNIETHMTEMQDVLMGEVEYRPSFWQRLKGKLRRKN